MQSHLLKAAFGRLLSIVGMVLTTTDLLFSSPAAMAIIVSGCVVGGGLISSTAQIMMTIEITPSTRRANPTFKSKPSGVGSSAKIGARSPRVKVDKTRGGSSPS